MYMKRIVIILIGLISVAYGQSSPTSAKTRFVNGLYVGTKLDSYFAAADSNAIYWRADSSLMVKYKGTARALAFAVSGGYIPYSDTTSLFSQVVRTFGTQTIGGNKTVTNDLLVNGLTVGRGLGSVGSNVAFGINALSSNTTGGNNTAIGTQTMILNTDASNNTAVGNGALNQNNGSNNTAVGASALSANSTGTNNTAVGRAALQVSTGGGNTAVGSLALNATTGGSNTAVGDGALSFITTQNSNTAIGAYAGAYVTGASNNTSSETSVFIGALTKAAATGQANQIVIGHDVTGNGSNTVTIGNSSVTDNYFSGNIRGGAFIKSGGTSSQFLKADGSVDGNTYLTTGTAASTYLPLTGGTLTGALNGTSLSMSGDISGARVFAQGTAPLVQAYSPSGTEAILRAYSGANYWDFSVASSTLNFKYLGTTYLSLGNTGALSGTSLSMSGIGLFNGATDDGTNKLIVNGGVKGAKATFETSVNPLESINNTGRQYGRFRTITNGGFIDFISSYGTTPVTSGYIGNGAGISSASETSFGIRSEGDLILMSGGNNIRLTLASSTGAATFSSSVTAGGNISTTSTTASTNTSNGALVVAGGVGIGGALNIAGAAFIDNSIYAKGHRFGYGAKASNYTLTDTDDYINVTASCTITLPTAVGRAGKRYVIKCIGSVTATIASTSSETIDGNAASTYTFAGPNFNIMIVYSNGANWNLEAWQTGI